jgi:hypothetical protein
MLADKTSADTITNPCKNLIIVFAFHKITATEYNILPQYTID